MYADLCELIARTPIPGLGEASPGKDANKGSKKFRKMLLLKVQQEFEKDWQGLFVTLQVLRGSIWTCLKVNFGARFICSNAFLSRSWVHFRIQEVNILWNGFWTVTR